MSGHSKWHTIKHKKGAADAKRGKIFTRLIKELTVAARSGGGDPGMNPRLRTIIAAAKEVNMPADNIKKAIQRGTGELPGIIYEEITYEAYGPGGSALIIETLTDNKNRTVGELRHMLEKHAGNLGATNSVAWMFSKKGLIVVEKAKADEEKLLSIALEAGADDMSDEGDNWEVLSDPAAFEAVRDAVKASGVEPASAQVAMLPQNYVKLDRRAGQPDDPPDGRARRSRRRQAGVVELRHRGEGDRGLAGVRVFGIDPGSDRTGYGCIDSDGRRHQLVLCGAVRAGAGATFPDQLVDHLPRAHGAARRAPARVRRHRKHFSRDQRAQRAQAGARARRGDARGDRGRRDGGRIHARRRSSAPSSDTGAPRSRRSGRW